MRSSLRAGGGWRPLSQAEGPFSLPPPPVTGSQQMDGAAPTREGPPALSPPKEVETFLGSTLPPERGQYQRAHQSER